MPTIPRNIAQPASAGRRAVAGDFGGGQGEAAVAGALGEIGQAASRLAEADMTQHAAVQAAEVRSEITSLVTDLSIDGDYNTHVERFEKAQKAIVKRHKDTIQFPAYQSAFQQQVVDVVDRARAHVRGNVFKRRVDSARGNLDRAGQLLADQLGEARDETEKIEIKGQFLMLMEIAERQNLIGAQDRFKREQAFDKEALGSDIREAIREDSADAVQGLLDGSLGADLPEAEIQVWLDRAVKKYESDLRKDDASERRERQARENAEKQELKAARSELDRLLDNGDLETLHARMDDLWDVLTTDDRQHYRRREEAGGGLTGGESNPGTYNTLDDLASRGQANTPEGLLVEDEIEAAYRRDDLNRADRDRLIKQLNDRRFGDAEEFLKSSLRVGEAAVGNARFIQQSKSAQALRVFQDWKIAHPKATREEAFDFSERLVRDSAIVDLGDIAIAQLTPTYIAKVGVKFDAVATGQKTREAFERGDLDDFEYAEQLHRIERLERAYQQAAGAVKP